MQAATATTEMTVVERFQLKAFVEAVMLVVFEMSKLAVSLGLLGTVAGVQLLAVFQSSLVFPVRV